MKKMYIIKHLGVILLSNLFCLIASPIVRAIDVSSFTELSNAIANGEAEVNLTDDLDFSSILQVSQNVKIIGNNHIITRSMSYSGGLFSIPAGKTLEINNVIIDGGAPGWIMDYDNRAYTNPQAGTGYVRVPTIDGETDIISNGSLVQNSGNFIMKESAIQNVRMGRYASNGSTNVNGAVISGKGDNTIEKSTIKHTGSYNVGGSLYITGGTTSIHDCIIEDNVAGVGRKDGVDGGFLYINRGNLGIYDSTIRDNFAQSDGGAASINNSDANINNVRFEHNMGGNDGSALRLESGTAGKQTKIEKSTFENNIGFATSGQSMGTIYQRGWTNSEDNPVIYKNLVFKNNTASTGGAIADYSTNNTHVYMEDIEVSGSVVNGGGILYSQLGYYSLKNVNVHDNSANYNGAGMYLSGTATITVDDSNISNNYSNCSGGGIYVAGGTLTLRDSTISNNKTNCSGGGIFVRSGNAAWLPELNIENSIVKNNSAGGIGGGISVKDKASQISSITINDASKIYDNKAEQAADDFSYTRDEDSENNTDRTVTLDNISIAGLRGIDGWYHDNQDDRFRDTENPTKFTDYIDNSGNIAFYLKAAGVSTNNYDGNGGTTNAKSIVIKYGNSYTVDDDIPTRNGYSFAGWNTRQDGTGITLKAGDSYDGTDGWVLYAQWVKTIINPSTAVYTPIIYFVLFGALSAAIILICYRVSRLSNRNH